MVDQNYPYEHYDVFRVDYFVGKILYVATEIELIEHNFGLEPPTIKRFYAGDYITFNGDAYQGENLVFFRGVSSTGDVTWWGLLYNNDDLNFTDAWNKLTWDGSKEGMAAQAYLLKTLQYNYTILNNNLLCARIIETAKQNGIKIPKTYIDKLDLLQNNLYQRNEELKNAGIYTESGKTELSDQYKDSLGRVLENKAAYVGVFPVWVIVVIVVIAIVGLSVAVTWSFFKNKYLSASHDFDFSNGLLRDLQKYLPKDVYDRLMAENEHNAKVASAAIAAASGSKLKNIGYLAAGLGIFLIAKPVLNTLGLNKKEEEQK